MDSTTLEQLRYPIGKFRFPEDISKDDINNWIDVLDHFPNRLERLVKDLTDEQLNTPYRP